MSSREERRAALLAELAELDAPEAPDPDAVVDAVTETAEAVADAVAGAVADAEPEPVVLVAEPPDPVEAAVAEAVVIDAGTQREVAVIDAQADAAIRVMEAEAALQPEPEPEPVERDEPPDVTHPWYRPLRLGGRR